MSDTWSRGREYGAGWLIRFMVWLTLRVGRPLGVALLVPITLWFVVALPRARAASRAYLGRALGRAPRAGDVWRHFFTFACVLLDRVCFLGGRANRIGIDVTGFAALQRTVEAGRGVILLGSHMGSFEVLRVIGREAPVRIRALMYRGTVRALTSVVEALDPALRDEIIEIGSPDAMLRVRESLQRGEIVGILADRAPSTRRRATVDFLGAPASLPTGPLALAASLGVPVMLFFGLRVAPGRYRVVLEPFADGAGIGTQPAELAALTQRYADRLAFHCREQPYNWFNFYDFWEARSDATAAAVRPGRPVSGPRASGRPPGAPAAAAAGRRDDDVGAAVPVAAPGAD